MNTTPNANRKHIGIYGNTNSGKSSLMNKILGQDISLVSNVEGTTTDPVQKAMELIPFGPVLLIDTAGLEDKSQLGEIRVKKSFEYLKRLDFAIYVVDGKNLDVDTYKKWKREANKYNIKHMVVVNKLDRLSDDERSNINNIFDKPLFISAKNNENIDKLKVITNRQFKCKGEYFMINKLKKALDNQESIKSTIIMYGENDFFEEEVFILGDNPLICIPKDELKYLKPIDYIGKIVEYIPVEINEEKNMVIGRIDKILNDYTYPLENEEDVILGTKLQGAIKDLFPTGCFIPVSPGKDVLCYFSPSINKNIDVEVGSKVLFTINKNCDGKFRGKVVEVLR